MGCKLSVGTVGNFDVVRVVHVSGYVQDFSGPVTVREVIGKRSKLVCFSPSQLLSQSSRPHGLDEQLEPGKLYFLLPHTVFHSGASAIDLATLATRLTAVARGGGVVVTRNLSFSGDGAGDGGVDRISIEITAEPAAAERYAFLLRRAQSGAWPWRPSLDTIEEKSMERPSRSLSSRSSSSSSSSSRELPRWVEFGLGGKLDLRKVGRL